MFGYPLYETNDYKEWREIVNKEYYPKTIAEFKTSAIWFPRIAFETEYFIIVYLSKTGKAVPYIFVD